MAISTSAHDLSARELVLFGLSLTLVILVGISVAGGPNILFFAIVLSAGLATVLSHRLFPGGPLFSLTFANLIAVYASIFAFFIEEIFGRIRPVVSGIGFSLPILFFLVGCWLRRAEVTAVVDHPDLRNERGPYKALSWLVPVFLVGLGALLLSWFVEAAVNTDLAFLAAMLLIGLIVLAVSRDVALFVLLADVAAADSRLCILDVLFVAGNCLRVNLQHHFATFGRGPFPGRKRCAGHQFS